MEALIRKAELKRLVGLSDISIWRMVRSKDFPQPLRIGKRAVAWRASDIMEWVEQRAARNT
jgi:prophage regulatory protein